MTAKLKLLIAICFSDKRKWLEETLKQSAAHNITVHIAQGIAKKTFINLLGLNDSNRIMMTAYIDSTKVKPLFEILQNELYNEPGSGIAFTIDIDAHAGANSMMMIDEFMRKFEGEKHGN